MRRMFSKKQIERLVAENPAAVIEALQNQDISINGLTSKGIANTGTIANIGDIAATGAITGKTLEQNEFQVDLNFSDFNTTEGITINKPFCKVIQTNRTLHFILSIAVVNTTEADISWGRGQRFRVDNPGLPNSVKAKIIDVEGIPLSQDQETSHTTLIRSTSLQVGGTSGGVIVNNGTFQLLRYSTDLQIEITMPSAISIPAGTTRYVFAELNLIV